MAKRRMTGTAAANEGFYTLFGNAVRRARTAAKIDQAGLAGKIGLSRTAVINIEQGRQGVLLHHGLDIAEAVGVPLLKLLDGAVEAARRAEIEALELRLKDLRGSSAKRLAKAEGKP